MNVIKLILAILFVIISTSSIFSQERLLNPTISFSDIDTNFAVYNCSTFSIDSSIAQYKLDNENEISPLIFTYDFETNITPSSIGNWIEADNLKIWRLKIK